MKRILATTAIVALTAFPLSALAQGTTVDTTKTTDTATVGETAPMTGAMFTTAEGAEISVEDLMGRTVYILREGEEQTDVMPDLTDAPDTWEDVAEIEDILVSQDGKIASVVIDAGGFLGIGEKRTRVAMEDLQLVPDTDDEGEYFVVYIGSRQLIEDADVYDQAVVLEEGYMSANEMHSENAADRPVATDAPMAADADRPVVTDTPMATDADRTMMPDRTTMQEVEATEVTTDQLEGLRVYGPNDESVGEVGELVVNAEGKIEKVIIDVGGFLGIGEKQIALDFNEIAFMRTEGMDDLTAYVNATEDQLKSMQEWEGTP